MGHIGETIAGPHTVAVMMAEALIKGVTPEQFRRKPQGVDASSAAFNLGHLCVYPEHVLDLIGRSDLAKHDQRYTDLFSAGKTCLDDPQGTIYPPMHEIMERFFSRYKVVVEAVKGVDDSAFLKDNPHPSDRMRSMLPTLGKMVAFLLDGHCHSHLGQVSTWRRCMGLPSAF